MEGEGWSWVRQYWLKRFPFNAITNNEWKIYEKFQLLFGCILGNLALNPLEHHLMCASAVLVMTDDAQKISFPNISSVIIISNGLMKIKHNFLLFTHARKKFKSRCKIWKSSLVLCILKFIWDTQLTMPSEFPTGRVIFDDSCCLLITIVFAGEWKRARKLRIIFHSIASGVEIR